MNSNAELVNYEKGLSYLKDVEDPVTRRLLLRAYLIIFHRFADRQDLPDCDLDLLFFLRALAEFCSEHEVLKRILDKDATLGWDEEEWARSFEVDDGNDSV